MIDYPPPLDWLDIINEQQWQAWLDHAASHDRWAVTAFVVSQWAPWAYAQGRDDLVRRWLYQLPPSALTARLYCARGWSALQANDLGATMVQLEQARAVQQAGDELAVGLFASACARRRGDVAEALHISQVLLTAVQNTPDRAFAISTIIGPPEIGIIDRGLDDVSDAQPLPLEQGDCVACALLEHDMAVSYEQRGDLRSVTVHLKKSLAYWHSVHNDPRHGEDPWLLLGLYVPRCRALYHLARVERVLALFDQAAPLLEQTLQATWEACAVALVVGQPGIRSATFRSRVQEVAEQLQLSAAHNGTSFAAHFAAYVDVPALWNAQTLLLDVLIEGALLHGARGQATQADQFVQLAQAINNNVPHPRLTLAKARCAIAQAQWQVASQWVAQVESGADAELALECALIEAEIACGQARRTQALRHLLRANLLLRPTTPGLLQLRALLLEAAAAVCVPRHQRTHYKQAAARAEAWARDRNAEQLLVALLAANHSPRSAATSVDDHSDVGTSTVPALPVLRVATLGRDVIEWSGVELSFSWRQAREVLVYLLEHNDGATTVQLGEAIWPYLDRVGQANTVKSAVRAIRKQLPDLIRTLDGRYQVQHDGVHIDYDAQRLRQAVQMEERIALEAACVTYQGQFLAHSTNPWAQRVRAAVERDYDRALTLLAVDAEAHTAWHTALGWWQHLVKRQPAQEIANTGCMRCHWALSDRAAVTLHYQQYSAALLDTAGLDVSRDSEAYQLYLRALR